MSDNGKRPIHKALALAALRRAAEETTRPDGQMAVVRYLIEEITVQVEQIAELKRERRKAPGERVAS